MDFCLAFHAKIIILDESIDDDALRLGWIHRATNFDSFAFKFELEVPEVVQKYLPFSLLHTPQEYRRESSEYIFLLYFKYSMPKISMLEY